MSKKHYDYSLSFTLTLSGIFFGVGIGIIVIGIVYSIAASVGPLRTIEVTVTEKTVKNYNESSKYLIFTETDNGAVKVFEITDSILNLRFNSSDLYGEIKEDTKYKIYYKGFRTPIISAYPNIYKVEEID